MIEIIKVTSINSCSFNQASHGNHKTNTNETKSVFAYWILHEQYVTNVNKCKKWIKCKWFVQKCTPQRLEKIEGLNKLGAGIF